MGDVADLRVNIVAALQVLEAKENADDNDGHEDRGDGLAGEIAGASSTVVNSFGITCAPCAL
ncbi:hypothetical protein CCASEI_09625 [Corynebacterium casei LMG S-19264]|uniref:Uncharacterized protein n=1 Tax=Corynebacterium casei LMG S-19264 TaxID=1285583 RepID=A0ABM5PR24_9CORY|nr:hypothetical protein CCASEI_09625 [Corynebacterium casei LMG S-19264]